MQIPPQQIRTERILARCWEVSDAEWLKEAIADTRTDLGRWTPWVIPQPDDVSVLVERIQRFREQFQAGQNFIYGLFDPAETRVLGQAGLYGRVGPDALEVGYWIRTTEAGQGLAKEATRALTDLAFRECGVARVELRCDVAHAASSAIAQRLGFQLREVLREPHGPAAAMRDLQAWQILASQHDPASAAPYTIAPTGRI